MEIVLEIVFSFVRELRVLSPIKNTKSKIDVRLELMHLFYLGFYNL